MPQMFLRQNFYVSVIFLQCQYIEYTLEEIQFFVYRKNIHLFMNVKILHSFENSQ